MRKLGRARGNPDTEVGRSLYIVFSFPYSPEIRGGQFRLVSPVFSRTPTSLNSR